MSAQLMAFDPDTRNISKHEKNLVQLPCAVCRSSQVTKHHCHGASMKWSGWHVGVGQKQNPWLQIPLCMNHHTGNEGIDTGHIGVRTWENVYGTQMEHLAWVNDQLPYNIWERARSWEKEHRTGITPGDVG